MEVLVNQSIISPSEIIIEAGKPYAVCQIDYQKLVAILEKGFCDINSTTDEEFGDYTWPEASVGDLRGLHCVFGPPNTNAWRECESREGRQWSDSIDFSLCDTLITMMYQVFDVVSIIFNSLIRLLSCSLICRGM